MSISRQEKEFKRKEAFLNRPLLELSLGELKVRKKILEERLETRKKIERALDYLSTVPKEEETLEWGLSILKIAEQQVDGYESDIKIIDGLIATFSAPSHPKMLEEAESHRRIKLLLENVRNL